MFLSAVLPLLLSTTGVSHAQDHAPGAAAPDGGRQEVRAEGDGGGGGGKNAKKGGKSGGKGGKGGKKDHGQKIAAAELSNSARTTKKGTLILSPLLEPSSYAVSDKVMVLVPIAPQLTGPKLGARYSFMNKKQKDLAVEPFASSDWQFASVSAGANVRYTMEMGKNRLNLAVGAGFSTDLDTVENIAASGSSVGADDIPTSGLTSTNLEVGYDLVTSDKTVWRFTASTDPYLDVLGVRTASVAANWNQSLSDNFRLSLGLGVYVGGSEAVSVLNAVGLDLAQREVVPLPTVELWWKF